MDLCEACLLVSPFPGPPLLFQVSLFTSFLLHGPAVTFVFLFGVSKACKACKSQWHSCLGAVCVDTTHIVGFSALRKKVIFLFDVINLTIILIEKGKFDVHNPYKWSDRAAQLVERRTHDHNYDISDSNSNPVRSTTKIVSFSESKIVC